MVHLATAAATEPPVAGSLGDNAAANASIARYYKAGERMRVIADAGWKICVAFLVLIVAAWVLGVLPGAVRLF
jgi:hypothetical protein